MRKFLFVLSFAALALVACKKEGGEAAAPPAEAKKEPMMAEEGKKEMPEEAAAPSGDSIGVPECDDYIAKMRGSCATSSPSTWDCAAAPASRI
jgi:hypothetical protein